MREGKPTEITTGMHVRFLDGGPDLVSGIVSGEPWVYFDGIDAVARVPVFVLPDRCVDVDGRNIYSVAQVGPGPAVELTAPYLHSGRV